MIYIGIDAVSYTHLDVYKRQMISLRKQENITQKELASLTGNKQQVISRIERKESIPTIRAFSHMLDALGYELKIVKKKSV